MTPSYRICLSLLCGLLLPVGLLVAEQAVPALYARVTDLTHTLTAAQQTTLETRLQSFAQHKGSQVAILLVPTTQPETIEQYSMRVVEAWRLGRKGVDDGVLLLVAKQDRTVRIEVGYGLEGALNDTIAHRIIDEFIVPHFKQDEFYLGLVAGVDRITQVIDGEALPAPAVTGSTPETSWFMLLVFAIVIIAMSRAIFGRSIGAVIAALGVGVVTWLVVGVLVVCIMAAVLAFMLTFSDHDAPWSNRSYDSWGGGFGGGSSSSGGFGGDGGGFGGGGASGRW